MSVRQLQPQREPSPHSAPDTSHKAQGQSEPAKEFSNPLKRRRMAVRAIPGGDSDFAF